MNEEEEVEEARRRRRFSPSHRPAHKSLSESGRSAFDDMQQWTLIRFRGLHNGGSAGSVTGSLVCSTCSLSLGPPSQAASWA